MARKKPNSKAATPSKQSQPPLPPPNSISGTGASAAVGGVSNVDHSENAAAEKPGETEAKTSGSNDSNAKNASPSHASVVRECHPVVMALDQGNIAEALRLMNDLRSKYENSPHSALIHHVMATVEYGLASSTDDKNAKQRHLRNAIESARKAVSLSPSFIDHRLFVATLLCEAATGWEDYEEAMVECERALAIENPVDPNKGIVQSDLRSLMRKSNIACISAWAKFICDGEERFWVVPNRRLVQDIRPNETTEVAKWIEERRKEIAVRVAAAARLQGLNKGKGLRKSASSNERRDRVLPYWNSMSLDGKKEFLRIKISDLRAHFSSSKDGSLSEVLDEALSFGEANKVWRFWACCCCDEIYDDAGSFMQHVMEAHMGSLSPNTESVEPVKKKWAEMLLKFPWKPLELTAATRTEFHDVEWMDCDGDQSSSGSLLNDNWSLSDDPERAKLLERIHANFQALIKHKCLASSHLKNVMHIAVEELQAIACGCGSQLSSNMERTPLCICFLGAPELMKILDFLQDISQSCGLSDKSNVADDSSTVMQGVDIVEKISFSPDASFLLLDEKFLPCKILLSSCDDVVKDVSRAPTSSHITYDNGVVLDSYALLSWIFTGTSSGEQLAYWKCGSAEKALQGLEIFQSLQKEYYHLHSLCATKSDDLNYEKALQAVSKLCLEERKRREHVKEFAHQSYETVLKKRLEELIGNGNEITIVSNSRELDAIKDILKDAKSQYLYLHQVDSCIEAAISDGMGVVSLELSELDARILGIIAGMEQLEVKIQTVSSNDFRTILIPLVKSFLQARLEDLAEKDAIEKSNAASEALLAELAWDSKKSGARLDSPKHMHGRTKDKKKSKEKRKNKNPKDTHSVELQDQKAKEIAHESEGQGHKIADPGDDDAWRLQEEEYKLRIESEADERKLEEALEYQRRMEDEAKWKHLAEQQKGIPETSCENAGTVSKPNAYFGPSDGDKYAKQSTIMKDPLEDVHKNIADGAMLRTVMKDADGTDTYGTGLKNEFGELNCFLNAVIQSLWHIRWFQYDFMLRTPSQHVHVGDPCVLCALYDIFVALRMASKDIKREAVAPTSLRVALSNLYPNSNFFQEGQMNDASELLNALLGCFHESFTPAESSPCLGSCIAHFFFGLEQVDKMNCDNCGLESRYLKYTSFYHTIIASSLRRMKVMHPQKPFEELLHLVHLYGPFACSPEAGGCGHLNYVHHFLSAPPHVYTIVLVWETCNESVEDIKATLAVLSTEIDISVIYRGFHPQRWYRLVSVVCYYSLHYICLVYMHDQEQWILYDDETVKVIGDWQAVLKLCERERMQPGILFFEPIYN